MRLSCPGCQTEYEVPDAALAGRVRTLRCAQCGHEWEYGPLMINEPADPVEAAWPGAAPRSIFSGAHAPNAGPESYDPADRPASYQPLDPPAREIWPPPAEPIEPVDVSWNKPSAEPADHDTTAELVSPEPASLAGEPTELAAKPTAGNEERFAALVKTSRNEPEIDEQSRPSARAGLFTTIILLIGIAAGIWAARFHIMQAWPPSTRLFEAINAIITHLTTPPHH